jgi:ABC-type uncharacterized transport system YnjBCD ATPase subunit
MKNRHGVLLGLIVLALFCIVGVCAAQADNATEGHITEITDDIEPYNGPIGADNALYGLKIAMEDLDETFTFNATERLDKRINHANIRIAEAKREMAMNRTSYAERALELYWQKLNLTETALTTYPSNATGLLHAQEMITKHQLVLENLLLAHPNNTGLARAYNNSLALEQKFEAKTAIRLDRMMTRDNKTILKFVRIELKERGRSGDGDGEHAETEEQTRDEQRDKINPRKNGTTVPTTMITQSTQGKPTPSAAAAPQETAKNPPGQENRNGNSNADDNQRGNSRNK